MQTENTACFTGHRPETFADYDEALIREKILDETVRAIDCGYTRFLCGMAKGADMVAGETVIRLKAVYPQLHLIAVVPFPKQAYCWEDEWISRYNLLIRQADHVVRMSPEYYPGCYMVRNRYMVDRSSLVIAVCQEQLKKGGTIQTIRYAEKSGKRVVSILL